MEQIDANIYELDDYLFPEFKQEIINADESLNYFAGSLFKTILNLIIRRFNI